MKATASELSGNGSTCWYKADLQHTNLHIFEGTLQSKGELLEKIDKGWAISNQAICGYMKADYTILLFVLFDSKELECFQQEREAICLKVIENKYLPTVHFINLWHWILQGWTAR